MKCNMEDITADMWECEGLCDNLNLIFIIEVYTGWDMKINVENMIDM